MHKLFIYILGILSLSACTHSKPDQCRVKVTTTAGGSFYFQPEESKYTAYHADSTTGTYFFELELSAPTYYRYIDSKQNFHTVYLTPGSSSEIIETADSVSFKGDYASENRFANQYRFVGHVPATIALYSTAWVDHVSQEVKHLIRKMNDAQLEPAFVAQHTLYYQWALYKQLLEGPDSYRMFANQQIELPADFYGFLDRMEFNNPLILNIPKWFNTLLGAFERMEKEGMIAVSPDNYFALYAEQIQDSRVRSHFLTQLLDFTLQKSYVDHLDHIMDQIDSMITDADCRAQLPELRARHAKSQQANSSISSGAVAPQFEAVDVNGKRYTSEDFKGQVVVLDFWFTGCVPCRAEMPYLEKMAEQMHDQPIRFISMSLDSGDVLLALWQKMVKDKPVHELHLNVPGGFKSDLAKAYRIQGVPRIVIIDKEGKIVTAYASRPSNPKLQAQLNALLK